MPSITTMHNFQPLRVAKLDLQETLSSWLVLSSMAHYWTR